jgi:hypothetical protein
MEEIREFADSPVLELTYGGCQRHPENCGGIVEISDTIDAQFMIDIASGKVVYMRASNLPVAESGSVFLPPRDLQDRVTMFVSNKNSCFDDIVDSSNRKSARKARRNPSAGTTRRRTWTDHGTSRLSFRSALTATGTRLAASTQGSAP